MNTEGDNGTQQNNKTQHNTVQHNIKLQHHTAQHNAITKHVSQTNVLQIGARIHLVKKIKEGGNVNIETGDGTAYPVSVTSG
jgi:ABC-type transport system involved in cytochrome bd biosynthesis fused ATPase/permease subunit